MNTFFHRLIEKPSGWVTIAAVVILLFLAFAGRVVAPYDPLALDTSIKYNAPNSTNWMGTDNLGRDILSRVIAGAGLAMQSAAVVLISAALVGLVIGCLAGYYGGIFDEILMRLSDVFIAFPGLVLAMAIAAALGPNLTNAMIAIAAVWWPGYARLVRAQAMSLKERDFVTASRAIGGSDFHIILRHIIPNLIIPLLVQMTNDVGPALVTSSSLSFIGMGAQPPTPEWGAMVSQGRNYILDYWWMSTFPGAAILATVMAFNSLGENIRRAYQIIE
ncbi:MAG: ABC transporter permease [Anaerolineaceae bacterium]